MNQSATCLSGWASAAAFTARASPLWRTPQRPWRRAGDAQAGLLAWTAPGGAPPRHGLRAHALAEALLDEAAQVRQGPARRLAFLRVGTAQDAVDQHRLLPSVSRSGRPPQGRSPKPGSPSALK